MGLHLSSPLLPLLPSFSSFFLPSPLLLTNNPRQPFEEDCWHSTPDVLPSSPQFTSTALPPLLSDRRCQFGLEYLPRSFPESSSLSFLIFAIPLEHLSPLIGFFVDESSNYFQRSWGKGGGGERKGFRAVQVSNDSARKGSDNCLVGSLLFLLSSSLVSVIFVYSLLSFLPTFFPFLFNGCWKWKKQRGRNANCVLFFFFFLSSSFLSSVIRGDGIV